MSSQQKSFSNELTPVVPSVINNPKSSINPPNKSLNFLAQSKNKSNSYKTNSIQPATSKNSPPISDPDKFCRSNYGVFGQITSVIIYLILIGLLILIAFLIYYNYVKQKILTDNQSFITSPIPLFTPLRVANSNNSPNMISNEFSYQFWLYITPPTTVSNSNFLIFLRDSDTFPPKFCIYFSNNGSTLNVASLLSGDYSQISNQQKTYINRLQFHLLSDFYLVASTSQISFYKWFFVSVVGSQNQMVLYINSMTYDSQVKPQNRSLQIHSGYIDIGYNNKFNVLDSSYISKLQVFNFAIDQNQMSNSSKIGPQ